MKKTLVFGALGAVGLTVVSTNPVMALENEFHGMYRLIGQVTNFNQTANTPEAVDGGYYPQGNPKSPGTSTFLEQRLRVAYTGKVNNFLKVVSLFEVNADFGDNAYSTRGTAVSGTMGGGAIGSNSVNLRTKEAYADINIPSTPVNLKVGIQPFWDAYKGVIFSTRAAGFLATAPLDNTTLSAAFFRFNDNFYSLTPAQPASSNPGKQTADFYLADVRHKFSKELTVGGSYYRYYNDIKRDQPDTDIHMLGVNAEAAFEPAKVNGFFVYQTGKDQQAKDLSAWALNLGAEGKAGKGTAHSEFLYMTGDHGNRAKDSSAFWVTQGNAAWENFYSPNLLLLGRDPYVMVTDNAIAFGNMRNQGLILGSAGYDYPLAQKLVGSVNVGFAAIASENSNKPINLTTGARNKSNYLGTEVDVSFAYSITENATIVPRAGYVFLGDYYKGVAAGGARPDNPYQASLVLNITY